MPFGRQGSLFNGNGSIEHENGLHHSNQQKNLDNFILVYRQCVVFVNDDTGNHRSKNGAKQRKEAKESGGEPALLRWHIVSDNCPPRRIRDVVAELQQEEKDYKGQQKRR